MHPILANLDLVLARQRTKGGGAGDYESTAGWDWGWRVHPVTKEKQKWHNGVDLAGPNAGEGTPIYAPWSGEVTKIWHLDDINGNAFRVDFYDDAPSEIKGASFVHMSKFAPGVDHVGATFNAGDVIGYIGNTGRSTGPHLHLTFWGYEAVPVAGASRRDLDPLPYLEEMAGLGEKKIAGIGITGGMLVSAFIIFMILRKR